MNLNKGVHKSQVAHQAGAYLWFPENEATRSISFSPPSPSPGCDASSESQILHQLLSSASSSNV